MPESEKYHIVFYSREYGLIDSLSVYEEDVLQKDIIE